MHKIIQILLFINVLQSTIHAETTREDVDKYLKVSRGGVIFENRYKFRYKTYFYKMYGYSIKKADKRVIEKYKAFILNPKHIDILYQVFSKMDDNSYYEIMAFYKTALGQKYTQAFRELYAMDIQDELMKSIMDKKIKLELPKIRELIIEINKAFYSKFSLYLKKNIFIYGNNKAIKKYKLPTNNKGEITDATRKILLDKFLDAFNQMAYRHFSDEELSQILEYANTYGKIEMAFLYHALHLNIDAFKKDLEIFLKEKALIENNSTNTKQH